MAAESPGRGYRRRSSTPDAQHMQREVKARCRRCESDSEPVTRAKLTGSFQLCPKRARSVVIRACRQTGTGRMSQLSTASSLTQASLPVQTGPDTTSHPVAGTARSPAAAGRRQWPPARDAHPESSCHQYCSNGTQSGEHQGQAADVGLQQIPEQQRARWLSVSQK
jgi:hypothetical protein